MKEGRIIVVLWMGWSLKDSLDFPITFHTITQLPLTGLFVFCFFLFFDSNLDIYISIVYDTEYILQMYFYGLNIQFVCE